MGRSKPGIVSRAGANGSPEGGSHDRTGMHSLRGGATTLLFVLLSIPGWAQVPGEFLPPVIPWDGASRSLVVEASDPWITPCELSGLRETPNYDETMAYLQKLVAASDQLRLISLGKSPERRDVWMVVASREGHGTAGALRRSGRPTVLAQAGIHSGEIDGKDAGLMLLRDMTVRGTKKDLLDVANFLFIPILSVDGHERISLYSRINQRGPKEMGWRTNARNLNLNRDYTKLDTPELRAAIGAIVDWDPDLYLDLHVTDGADYQYDITFGFTGQHGWSPSSAKWLEEVLSPALDRDLASQGHIPGPLVFAMGSDMSRGIANWSASPRFSNGYGDARHLPTVLVENHSLKPYDQRVLGTYVLLESTLRAAGSDGSGLRKAIEEDRQRLPEELALSFAPSQQPTPTIAFLGIESEQATSTWSGADYTRWLGKAVSMEIPYLQFDQPTTKTKRPAAYWVPPAYSEVIEILQIHGVELEITERERVFEGEILRFQDPEFAEAPFEGRFRMTASAFPERRTLFMPPGSARIDPRQPLGDLAMLLLEPDSEDSFFQWGFFPECFQRTEYAESYALEPLGEQMLAKDEDLRRGFESRKAEDEEFAQDPRAQRNWMYERSPYYDHHYLVYPVKKEPAP